MKKLLDISTEITSKMPEQKSKEEDKEKQIISNQYKNEFDVQKDGGHMIGDYMLLKMIGDNKRIGGGYLIHPTAIHIVKDDKGVDHRLIELGGYKSYGWKTYEIVTINSGNKSFMCVKKTDMILQKH
jgi:hypothetical protein